MGEAVERLYDQNLGHQHEPATNDTFNEVSRLQWKLSRWQDSLPPYLRILTTDNSLTDSLRSSPLEIARFCVLLSLHYHGTRIFVLRPILRPLLDQQTTSSVVNKHQSTWLLSSSASLLEDILNTSRDVLYISRDILTVAQNDKNLMGAWWFSCFFSMDLFLFCCLSSAQQLETIKNGETNHSNLQRLMPPSQFSVFLASREILRTVQCSATGRRPICDLYLTWQPRYCLD